MIRSLVSKTAMASSDRHAAVATAGWIRPWPFLFHAPPHKATYNNLGARRFSRVSASYSWSYRGSVPRVAVERSTAESGIVSRTRPNPDDMTNVKLPRYTAPIEPLFPEVDTKIRLCSLYLPNNATYDLDVGLSTITWLTAKSWKAHETTEGNLKIEGKN